MSPHAALLRHVWRGPSCGRVPAAIEAALTSDWVLMGFLFWSIYHPI
jgi:hypothetical protein